jgi:hypothetical protein
VNRQIANFGHNATRIAQGSKKRRRLRFKMTAPINWHRFASKFNPQRLNFGRWLPSENSRGKDHDDTPIIVENAPASKSATDIDDVPERRQRPSVHSASAAAETAEKAAPAHASWPRNW